MPEGLPRQNHRIYRAIGIGTTILTLMVVMTGCELNRQGLREVAAAWDRHQDQSDAEAGGYARVPATRPAERAEQPITTQPGLAAETADQLQDYIQIALEKNPDIVRAAEMARARAHRIPQATSLPDPMLTTRTLPEPVRTAEGDNYFNLGISQKLIVPEKLTRAGKMALEETRMAIEEWQRVRLRVIAEVKRSYFRIYVIDRTIEITRDNQDLLTGLIDAVRGQVAAGMRRQEDLLRAQVELSDLESELINLRQRRVSAAAMLNNLMNRPPATEVPSPEPFAIRRLQPELERLMARAVERNPELTRLARQIERDRHGVRLARLEYWPDFNLGFEWMYMEPRDAFEPPRNPQTGQRPPVNRMSEEASDNWAITFGFNLPIWFQRIEAGIREARAELSASMYQYDSTRNEVYFRIEDALSNVLAQEELAQLFATTIIPQARQAYEVSRSGYMAGLSDFQYVIDNWRKWLTFKIQYHRAIGQLEQSLAALEQAVGMSYADMEQTREP